MISCSVLSSSKVAQCSCKAWLQEKILRKVLECKISVMSC